MITCPVCNTSNHHLKISCVSCGSYIQQKVDTLDLFGTIWKLIETPKKAFHAIAIATHKNYSLLLGSLSGYAFVALIFWLIKAGDIANHIVELMLAWLAVSPVVGLIIFFLNLFFLRILMRATGNVVSFRNLMGVVSYSFVPLIISAFLILPIEVITFGIFLFTKAPNPFTLLPQSAIFLFSFDAILSLWSFLLYVIGIRTLLDCSLGKALLFSIVAIGLTVITIAGTFIFFTLPQ
ncbi:MAG: YIP1 family protein [Ignavibacteriae bacterium]|nr:YIP1 family protein [Ignavibacteriota bacterium]